MRFMRIRKADADSEAGLMKTDRSHDRLERSAGHRRCDAGWRRVTPEQQRRPHPLQGRPAIADRRPFHRAQRADTQPA